MGTKAETINSLSKKLHNAQVLPVFYFSVNDWNTARFQIISTYRSLEWNENVIVRSSAVNEDAENCSRAGEYCSVLHVKGEEKFVEAVTDVISSYDDNNPDNQILVQPMLENVKMGGVAFTLEPNTMGNYYVINYDVSGSTDAITSGTGQNDKLVYIFKGKTSEAEPKMQKICRALEELEVITGTKKLDVEFAMTTRDELYILQVRPLCVSGHEVDIECQKRELQRIADKINSEAARKPFICGKKAIYGVMSDWNPAEMIGIRPEPLALSLYKEVITDNIWAYQRDNYGYRNLRSFPLMVDFCGLPYIDIRVSFNSFIPASLDENISEKLVDYYIERLEEDPTKHDKVEFQIVFSCYTLDLSERIQILKKYGFSDTEIEEIILALRDMTNTIINHETGLWRSDYEKLNILEKRYQEIVNSKLNNLEKIYWLIEDCKRYGTLPFAGLARAAFIAVQMLQSMVTKEIISSEDYQQFMNDLSTVSSDMGRDFFQMARVDFLEKYGHLRPGTYNITSKRYDEAPDLYFNWNQKRKEKDVSDDNKLFRLSLEQLHNLTEELREKGLNNDILGLMDFIRKSIEGREYGKFVFTKNISKVIQLIGEIGKEYGFNKEDCSFLDIRSIMNLYSTTKDLGTVLKRSIERGKKEYVLTRSITLPPVIMDTGSIWSFQYPETVPNFITLQSTSGKVVILQNDVSNVEIDDKIVLITSADPGYDWMFSHNIKGFITKYGGANSHMAIRAGELGIPAVIGVGTEKFELYKKAEILEIDSLAKTVRVIC